MKLSQTLLAAALLAPVVCVAPANAADWYLKASVGESDGSVSGLDLNAGTSYGAALGTAVGPFRVEAGVDHLAGDFAGVVNAEALAYHGGAYLDLPIGENASIFGGAGVTYVDGEASIGGFSIDASGEGYFLAAGGAYRLNDRMIGEVSYRHLEADLDTDFGGVDLEADQVMVGLRLAL